MKVINTPAYYSMVTIRAVKSFIVLALGEFGVNCCRLKGTSKEEEKMKFETEVRNKFYFDLE